MYKELLPKDSFIISIPETLSFHERQLLTLFYQPIIGVRANSLYFTLWSEGEMKEQTPNTHYYLMNVLDLSTREILEARASLEAIGLLRTWQREKGEQREFIYELLRPLSAVAFFEDPLLSMLLFSKIGEYAYRKLRSRFQQSISKEGYTEVSRTFTDVYRPVNVKMDPQLQKGIEHVQAAHSYPFYMEDFNFDLLRAGLTEQLVPSKVLTVEVREQIAKLAFMYQFTPIDMQKIVILALGNDSSLSLDRLRKAAADYYKLSVSKEPPQMVKAFEQAKEMTEKPLKKSGNARPSEQELINYLEHTSPIQLLREINKGKEPLPTSVQLVNDLVTKHDLPIGVVNVLIEYVMLTTDMRLPQKYVERIADHWMRKGISTAKEAMELARQERDKYAKWKAENDHKQTRTTQKPSSQPRQQQKSGRTEKVPDWFYKRDEKESVPQAEVDFELERQKILQKLGQNGQVNNDRID